MKILSLFDGMSCGQLAIDRIGIKNYTYYAAEIDKYAIQIAKKNFPNTIHIGNVTAISPGNLPKIDLLIGGSPCQGFSFAGKQLAFDDPRSKLFFEYVRLLKKLKPKYFLLENVRMKKEYLDIITEYLGVEPVLINSSLFSAQNRQRYYWTNIPFDKNIIDKGTVLKDILEEGFNTERNKSHCLDANYYKGSSVENYKKKSRRQMVFESPKQVGISTDMSSFKINDKTVKKYVPDIDGEFCDPYNKKMIKGNKSTTLRTNSSNGNLWINQKPKQVGIATDINGHDILKRVYSQEGKSPTLTTMGGGHREPKVAIDDIYWRKLTPLECERLQTVPDNYTEGVSNTQRYKMLGNGWTVDVISHILKNMEVNNE